MQSCTKSAEKPATQGTQRCKGRFMVFANDGSRNPLVAAGAPNRVDCITGHLSRGPDCAAPPEICGNVEDELFISVMAIGKQQNTTANKKRIEIFDHPALCG